MVSNRLCFKVLVDIASGFPTETQGLYFFMRSSRKTVKRQY